MSDQFSTDPQEPATPGPAAYKRMIDGDEDVAGHARTGGVGGEAEEGAGPAACRRMIDGDEDVEGHRRAM